MIYHMKVKKSSGNSSQDADFHELLCKNIVYHMKAKLPFYNFGPGHSAAVFMLRLFRCNDLVISTLVISCEQSKTKALSDWCTILVCDCSV